MYSVRAAFAAFVVAVQASAARLNSKDSAEVPFLQLAELRHGFVALAVSASDVTTNICQTARNRQLLYQAHRPVGFVLAEDSALSTNGQASWTDRCTR